MKSSLVLLCAVVCLVPSAFAGVGGGPYELSTVTLNSHVRPLMLLVRPDGSGRAFNEAFGPAGTVQDATVVVQLLNDLMEPVPNVPRQDIWLATIDGGLVACGGEQGLLPDAGSDADGYVYWTEPPRASGFSDGRAIVIVEGDALPTAALDLYFVSADMDGDGRVDLSDAGRFTDILYGDYALRADFNYDGAVNVSDAGEMASALGAHCP